MKMDFVLTLDLEMLIFAPHTEHSYAQPQFLLVHIHNGFLKALKSDSQY